MESYLHAATRRLVAFDSVSFRNNQPLMDWLAEELEGHGLRTALHRHETGGTPKANLVAWCGPPEPGGLALSGHADVVPFAEQPGWSQDPLELCRRGARLGGRGTSDMKGFLAQCLDAVRRLRLDSLQRPLVLLFTCDEETGCRGAERLVPLLPELLREVPLPRLCWIGEPTSYRVFHTHKGIVEFSVVARGRGGHSGVPEAGVNAIAVAARAVQSLGGVQAELREQQSRSPDPDYPDSPYTTVNFGTIRGGSAANMIAEECRFSVSYRPLPESDPLEPYREMAARLAALEPADFGSPGLRGSIEVGEPLVVPGMRAARETALEGALFESLGLSQSAGGAPYCTDAGRFASAGMDSLICGPGDLEQAHQPDESISVAALERGSDLILSVLAKLCGARAGD